MHGWDFSSASLICFEKSNCNSLKRKTVLLPMMLCSRFFPPILRLRVSGVIKCHGNKTLLSIIFHAEHTPNWNSPLLYQYVECIVQTDLKQGRIHISFSFSSHLTRSLASWGRTTHPLSSCITDTILACVWVCVCARGFLCVHVLPFVQQSSKLSPTQLCGGTNQ